MFFVACKNNLIHVTYCCTFFSQLSNAVSLHFELETLKLFYYAIVFVEQLYNLDKFRKAAGKTIKLHDGYNPISVLLR